VPTIANKSKLARSIEAELFLVAAKRANLMLAGFDNSKMWKAKVA